MQVAGLDLLDVDPFDLVADEEPFAEPVKAAEAGLAELLDRALRIIAEFDESEHKRDRRGRFSKSAGQVVSELDDLAATVDKLAGDLSDDDDDDGDIAEVKNLLEAIRERRHAKANRREATIELAQHGDVTVLIHDDGDVGVDWNEGDDAFFFPPATAKELAAAVDKLVAVDATGREPGQDSAVIRKIITADGEFAVARWNTGVYDIGPAGSVGVDEPQDAIVEVEDDEIADFADLLDEMADRSLGKVKAKGASRRSRVEAHLPGQHDQSDHGRKKGLPKLPSVKTPAAAVPKAPAKKAAPRKATPKPSPSEVDQAQLKLDRAVKMHGSDRSKWLKKDRDAAAKLDKLISDSDGGRAAPEPKPAKKVPAKRAPRKPTEKSPAVEPAKEATPASATGRVSDEDFTAARGGEKASKKLSKPDNGSHVELVTFGDGSKAIYKASKSDTDTAKSEFDAEQLGAHVAEALGLKPPKMHRTDDDKAYFDYVDSGRVAGSIPSLAESDDSMHTGEFHDSRDGRRIGLLDALVENPDRHQGNWIVHDDGSITPIDHGLSWEAALDSEDLFPPDRATGLGGFTDHYIEQKGFTGEWRDNDLSPKYVESLRERLAALRSAFDDAGHSALHDRMMARLEIIASHAKGSVVL